MASKSRAVGTTRTAVPYPVCSRPLQPEAQRIVCTRVLLPVRRRRHFRRARHWRRSSKRANVSVCGPPTRAPAGRYHLGIKSDAGRRESFHGDRFVGSANFTASGGTLWASESVQPPDGHLDVPGGRKPNAQDVNNCSVSRYELSSQWYLPFYTYNRRISL